MKAMELAVSQRDAGEHIAIALTTFDERKLLSTAGVTGSTAQLLTRYEAITVSFVATARFSQSVTEAGHLREDRRMPLR